MINTNILASAIQPLVASLSSKNIQVLFEADVTPYVQYDYELQQPVSMHLPIINDDIDKKALGLLRAQIDHECGHLLYTDPAVIAKMPDTITSAIFNAVEDPRIEKKMQERFFGCKAIFEHFHDTIEEEVEKWAPKFSGSLTDMIFLTMLIARSHHDSVFYQSLFDKYPKIKEYRDCFPFTKEDFVNLKDSEDTFALTERIVAFLKEQMPGLEDLLNGLQEQMRQEKKARSEPFTIPLEGEKKKDDQNKGVEKAENNGGEGNGENPSDHKNKDSESEKQPQKINDKKKKGKPTDADLTEVASVPPCDVPHDVFKKMLDKKVKSHLHEYSQKSTYSVPTHDQDKFVDIKSLVLAKRDLKVARYLDPAKLADGVNALRTILQRKLIAKSRCVWTGGHKRGRLNASSLHRLQFGDDKVFSQKSSIQSKSVAICLMIDCSGSMRGDPIEVAFATAYMLCKVFQSINIKFEVLGYTTGVKPIAPESEVNKYSRLLGLQIFKFKDYKEPFTADIGKRFSFISEDQHWMAENIDGESLMIGYKRLIARPEERKIMMVLSDGEPSCYGCIEDLRNNLVEVAKYISSQIELVSFGIQADLEKYYDSYIRIDHIKDIPTKVVQKLDELLL